MTGPDTFDLLFHCITTDGEILSGRSRGKVEVGDAGRNARLRAFPTEFAPLICLILRACQESSNAISGSE